MRCSEGLLGSTPAVVLGLWLASVSEAEDEEEALGEEASRERE